MAIHNIINKYVCEQPDCKRNASNLRETQDNPNVVQIKYTSDDGDEATTPVTSTHFYKYKDGKCGICALHTSINPKCEGRSVFQNGAWSTLNGPYIDSMSSRQTFDIKVVAVEAQQLTRIRGLNGRRGPELNGSMTVNELRDVEQCGRIAARIARKQYRTDPAKQVELKKVEDMMRKVADEAEQKKLELLDARVTADATASG